MSFLDNLKALFGGSAPAQPEPEKAPEAPVEEIPMDTGMEMPEVQTEETETAEEETTEEPEATE